MKLRGSTLRQKSYVGHQYPNATGNIFCRRYYSAQIFNVSSSLFNNAEKYEIYCPQWLGGCGWAAFVSIENLLENLEMNTQQLLE